MCTNRPTSSDSGDESEEMNEPWQHQWERLQALWLRLEQHFNLQTHIRKLQQYAEANPLKSLCVVVACCVCSLPIMGFALFVFWSVFLTFCGFLVVEGALLSVGLVVLAIALAVFGMVSVVLATVLVVSYLTLTNGRSALSSARPRLERLVQQYAPEHLDLLYRLIGHVQVPQDQAQGEMPPPEPSTEKQADDLVDNIPNGTTNNLIDSIPKGTTNTAQEPLDCNTPD